MFRKILILLLLGLLAACGQGQQSVDAPTAPTTAPLQSAAQPTAAPATTQASAVPEGPTDAPAGGKPGRDAPTTIVPPHDTINLPEGFGISVFESKLKAPRMMTVGPDGAVYVAERGANRIVRLPDRNADGVSDGVEVVADNLDSPSSMAFREDELYVAETTRVIRLTSPDAQGLYQQRSTIIDGLPDGGHSTRTLLFNADFSKLYVSIGSSCNVCNEDDERRATVMVYNPDGSDGQVYAKGLRNAVGITFRPGTDEIWASNNGRDQLGDDQPPETINLIGGAGLDFGWPRCHAGRIPDPEFAGATGCTGVSAPAVEMQAHSAPLGLAFAERSKFPEPYRSGLFVAFHGSWNRSTPTGYKVVFVPVSGGQAGPAEDFATGWLKDDGTVWGRPVDVLGGTDGSLYVSDDAGGVIYRIFWR
jgi:glucose/arabinose dehydrogenase